jgi:hypothetical protein
VLINATGGVNSLAALEAAGAENVNGKVLLDVSNPLDFSHGMPPTLAVCGWPAHASVDLGDISGARATEMYMPLWLRLFMPQGTPNVNIRIVEG